VDGAILLRLEFHHLSIMVDTIGDRFRIYDEIQELKRVATKPETHQLTLPNWVQAWINLLTFEWADTSEGKDAEQQKEESEDVNGNLAVIASLVWTISWGLFFGAAMDCYCYQEECYCKAGFNITQRVPMVIFYCFSGMAAMAFMWAALIGVLQIIMVNEMSDAEETTMLMVLFGKTSQLPGRYLTLGAFLINIPIGVYCMYNNNAGVMVLNMNDNNTPFSWITAMTVALLICHGYYYKLPSMVRNLYLAKIESSKELLDIVQTKVRDRETFMPHQLQHHDKYLDEGIRRNSLLG